MTSSPPFDGFPEACTQFYTELARDNSKTWFEAHRADFEEHVMTPARHFVVSMGARLKTLSPNIQADPRVDKSIFRIHRDTRFSPDKTPYKIHLGVWLWEGPAARLECSGYYFQLEPPNLMLGVGIYMFPDSLLHAYREWVAHPEHGPALVEAIRQVADRGPYQLGGTHYKRVPRGYDPDHERADLLRYKGLYAGIESAIPDEFYTPAILDYCMEKYTDMYPIHRWLLALTEEETG